jgi:hypothetical protein
MKWILSDTADLPTNLEVLKNKVGFYCGRGDKKNNQKFLKITQQNLIAQRRLLF